MQQLRALIDAGGQESLDSLPDGIHSGLAKAAAKGIFFYFQGCPTDGPKSHFWKYYDLKDRRIIDNRYIVANLIACQKDTARIVDPEIFRAVLNIQEQVIEDILQSEEQKRALEVAPRAVDPIQQTVATAIQSFLNHPDVDRKQAIEVIRFLNQPMLTVQVRKLRQYFKEFQGNRDIRSLLGNIADLRETSGFNEAAKEPAERTRQLRREELRLICFDVLTAG
jgi:hypothetical protein